MSATSFSPTYGPALGGTNIIILGYGFNEQTTVTIDNIECIIIYYNSTYIMAVTPPGTGKKEVKVNNEVLSTFFTYDVVPPVQYKECINPPYNATNFTNDTNNTLRTYGNLPNYPFNTGTDANQIPLSRQNISYFNGINQQTIDSKNSNATYPQFKSQTERLMYIQGQTLMSARSKTLGQRQTSMYDIIYPK